MSASRAPSPVSRVVQLVKEGILLGADGFDLIRGRRDPLVPPRRLMFDGPRSVREFKQNGAEFFRYFLELADLKPTDAVLDVGSGMGRKTLPLTSFLAPSGRYDGIEIVKSGVDWCRANITAKHANFQFQHIDVFSGHYNPGGRTQPVDFRFPFTDDNFDFVVLGSVFTHMLPGAVTHYLDEIARVLRPGGRSLITYFLLNDESSRLLDAERGAFRFRHRGDGYRAEDPDDLERAVALDEALVREAYAARGMRIREPIRYGSWCERTTFLSFQDIIVATKV